MNQESREGEPRLDNHQVIELEDGRHLVSLGPDKFYFQEDLDGRDQFAGDLAWEQSRRDEHPLIIRTRAGRELILRKLEWTVNGYYQHDGPGWDCRRSPMEHFGLDPFSSPKYLPNIPLYEEKGSENED